LPAVTVDGETGDWTAENTFTDPVDNTGHLEIVGWGVVVLEDVLYGYYEYDGIDVAEFVNNATGIFSGLFIDIDNDTNTFVADGLPTGLVSVVPGADILIEFGGGLNGEGFNFWGVSNDIWNIGSPIGPNGAVAYPAPTGNVLEWSCSLDHILSELALPGYDAAMNDVWQVAVAGEALYDSYGISYGRDCAGTATVRVFSAVSSISITGDTVTLGIQDLVPGVSYRVQGTTNLSAGWTNLDSFAAGSTQTSWSAIVTAVCNRVFFRIWSQ